MHWIIVTSAAIGFGLGLFDIRVGALYAGLNFVAIVAAGLGASSRGGAVWLISVGGKPTERLTAMEKRLASGGLAGIVAVLAALVAGPQI